MLVASVTGCGLLPALAQAAPTNTSLPKVAGTTQQGDTLTLTQERGPTPPSGYHVTDEWRDCDSGGGTCSATGQAGPTYTLTSNDVGHTIVVARDGDHIATETRRQLYADRDRDGALTAGSGNIGVDITGTAQQGVTLTASQALGPTRLTSFDYQWMSCSGSCTNVGSNSAIYAVAATDVGKTIKVAVTASNAGGAGAAATSSATGIVIPAVPVIQTAPAITGTATQGQTLTAGQGTGATARPRHLPVGELHRPPAPQSRGHRRDVRPGGRGRRPHNRSRGDGDERRRRRRAASTSRPPPP